MLGALLIGLALFFADSVATIFRLFPMPVLGSSCSSAEWNSPRPSMETRPDGLSGR
jgi:hypothetical protein